MISVPLPPGTERSPLPVSIAGRAGTSPSAVDVSRQLDVDLVAPAGTAASGPVGDCHLVLSAGGQQIMHPGHGVRSVVEQPPALGSISPGWWVGAPEVLVVLLALGLAGTGVWLGVVVRELIASAVDGGSGASALVPGSPWAAGSEVSPAPDAAGGPTPQT